MSKLPDKYGWALHNEKRPDGSFNLNENVSKESSFSASKSVYDIYGDYTKFPEFEALKREIEKKGWLTVSEVSHIIEEYREYDEILATIMMLTIVNGG